MVIQICVGSACCIRGSEKLVEKFQHAITHYNKEAEITLAGCFCIGKCNAYGVTVQVNDEIFTGITPESFEEFWNDTVLKKLEAEG
ncbi:MAG: NAD(P)H-dependent oxidoreductase subunit E [Clostridia bacterium]|nr:NAD(P)H-dependent oxidoreductase subunit E [Clostridia bacterium]